MTKYKEIINRLDWFVEDGRMTPCDAGIIKDLLATIPEDKIKVIKGTPSDLINHNHIKYSPSPVEKEPRLHTTADIGLVYIGDCIKYVGKLIITHLSNK